MQMTPGFVLAWFGIGLVFGFLSRKILFPRSRGGGTFLSLIQTGLLGMVGSALGVIVTFVFNLPGAGTLGPISLLAMLIGTVVVTAVAVKLLPKR